jgi:hypothetical protein
MVVYLPGCEEGRWAAAPGSETLSAFGSKYFASREAYSLTYTSCQESGKFNGLYRSLAAEMGTEVATVRAA